MTQSRAIGALVMSVNTVPSALQATTTMFPNQDLNSDPTMAATAPFFGCAEALLWSMWMTTMLPPKVLAEPSAGSVEMVIMTVSTSKRWGTVDLPKNAL
jgi:hypothetical protein